MSVEIHKYIPAIGPIGATFMLLFDCPSYKDVDVGKFTLDKDTREVLHDAGIYPPNCWISTVSKYHVPPNITKKNRKPFAVRAKEHGVDLHQQLEELQNEINGIKPNCILAFGSTALWALSGRTEIGSFRGSILHGMGTKFVPTYRPSDLSWQAIQPEFKGYWNRQVMIFDAKRALRQSLTPHYNPPQRVLQICRNSFELAEFINRYKDKIYLSVDIEAAGSCIPVCIGLAFNKNHGMSVPLWNKDGISNIPDSDLVQIWLLLAQVLYEKEIIGQNFNYDRDKIKRLGFIIRKVAQDVLLKAQAINPELPKSLAFQTSIFTEEPYYKDEGMYHGTLSDLFIGNARDACVTFEVAENMDDDLDQLGQRLYYERFLMRLPELYWGIEQQGFKVDTEERDRLLRKYIEWDERVRYELFQIVGTEVNVNSPKQVSILLYENFKLPNKGATGEDELTALLNSSKLKNQEHRKVIELILEGRRVRKSISTYLMALPDFDGRMRTTYFPCLDTGRSSTGQQDPPIRPTVEVVDENGKKKDKVLGIAFQTMTKHGDIGADIRGMYVPDSEEEIFVQADSSQAEARVIFLLADDEQALKDIDTHDYHALTASWFFGGTEDDYSKKKLGYEHPIRFVGKTLRHAGHLGAGKKRASISVNSDARRFKIPITIDEALAERALKIFHSRQPRIQQVFQAQVIECLKRNRQLVAPMPYGMDVEVGGKRTFFERWGEELFRQAFSYMPQRAVSDNTKAAGLRIKARIPTIKIVMESHDALLFSIPKDKLTEYSQIIKQEFERPISFKNCSLPRRSLKIPCEIETGNNYRDFKKFKDIPIIGEQPVEPVMPERTPTEKFAVVELPPDSKLTEIIYHSQTKRL